MGWAQRIWSFRGGAADLIANVSIIFKLHVVLGLTIFLLFPFTRLVHILSGFASVFYLLRPYQLVRSKGAGRRPLIGRSAAEPGAMRTFGLCGCGTGALGR